MEKELLYSENPKMLRNRPFLAFSIIILNIAGIIAAIRLDQQSLQIIGLVLFLVTVMTLLIWYLKIKIIYTFIVINNYFSLHKIYYIFFEFANNI